MVFCRCECHAAMQLVLGRLAATQSAKPLTRSLLVDQPFFTDLVVPENFGRPGSAAGAAALNNIMPNLFHILSFRSQLVVTSAQQVTEPAQVGVPEIKAQFRRSNNDSVILGVNLLCSERRQNEYSQTMKIWDTLTRFDKT